MSFHKLQEKFQDLSWYIEKHIHNFSFFFYFFKNIHLKIVVVVLIVFYFYNYSCIHNFVFFYNTFEFITSNKEMLTIIVNIVFAITLKFSIFW
jgi:hypothetical protein